MNSVLPASGPETRKVRTSRFRRELALAPLVLVGERDSQLRRALAALFRRKGYRVRAYSTAGELVSRLWESRGDLDTPEHVVFGVAGDELEVLESLGALDLASGLPPTTVLVRNPTTQLADVARLSGASRVMDRSRALSLLPPAVADAAPSEWADDD
jgi:hypothetical protein